MVDVPPQTSAEFMNVTSPVALVAASWIAKLIFWKSLSAKQYPELLKVSVGLQKAGRMILTFGANVWILVIALVTFELKSARVPQPSTLKKSSAPKAVPLV